MHPIPRPFELRSEEACGQFHFLPAASLPHDGLCASHVSRFPAVPRVPDVTQQMFDVKNMDGCCHLIDAKNVELSEKMKVMRNTAVENLLAIFNEDGYSDD